MSVSTIKLLTGSDWSGVSVLVNFFHLVVLSVSAAAAAAAKSLQSCPTLCNPKDGSPPGSSVPGILQARVLEWVAIAFSISMCKAAQKHRVYPLGGSFYSYLFGCTRS